MSEFFERKAVIEQFNFSFRGQNVAFDVLREDLLHEIVSGNKIRKLRYWMDAYYTGEYEGIISFGGAYSNHLSALAFVLKENQIPGIFFVREGKMADDSLCLDYCKREGMDIVLLGYGAYRERNNPTYLRELQKKYPKFLIVPEGGSGSMGVAGVQDMVDDRLSNYRHIYCALGTGATALGLANALPKTKVIGVSAVPQKYLSKQYLDGLPANLRLNFDCLFGGYAELPQELKDFIEQVYHETGLLLDPIYTCRALYALLSNNLENSLLVHTGGLQGFLGHLDGFPWIKSLLPHRLVGKL